MRPFAAAGKGMSGRTGSQSRSPSSSQPVPTMPAAGGRSMAFGSGADAAGKKRGLAALIVSSTSSSASDLFNGGDAGDGAQKQQQQHGWQQHHGGGGDFTPLSPLSEHTSAGSQRTPLSEALAIAARPRRKVPRRGGFGASADGVAESDDSDDDGFAFNAFDAAAAGGVAETLPTGNGGGWAILQGAPPHLMANARRQPGAASMPHAGAGPFEGFRPGSVMEGAGRKLSGTDAMRMRNAVLRQTGFLEPTTNILYSDHLEHGVPDGVPN